MLAPPMLPVPPPTYAGTERVIAALIDELARRGHAVTLFGPGDSTVDCGIAAKVYDARAKEHDASIGEPAIAEGVVDFLGELGEPERDALYAGALATVMLGAWPEPFGLVAIESMAAGTPVIARRAGALTETIEHGVDGFLVDDLTEAELAVSRVRALKRARIRKRAVTRFSPARMA